MSRHMPFLKSAVVAIKILSFYVLKSFVSEEKLQVDDVIAKIWCEIRLSSLAPDCRIVIRNFLQN